MFSKSYDPITEQETSQPTSRAPMREMATDPDSDSSNEYYQKKGHFSLPKHTSGSNPRRCDLSTFSGFFHQSCERKCVPYLRSHKTESELHIYDMKAAPDDIIKDIVDFLDFPEDTKQKVEEARTNVKCKWKNLKTTKFIDLLERTCRNYPVMCTERQAEEWFDAVRAELLIDVDNIDEVDAARFIQFVTNYKMMIDGQNWQSGETVCSVVKRIYDDLILFMGLQASLIRKGEKIFKIRWKSRYQKSGSDGFHEMCASPDLLLTTIYPRSVQDRLTASSNAMVPVLVMEVCGSTMEEVQFLNEETLHAESGSGSSSSSEKSSSERPTKKARLQELPNTLHAQHFSKLLLTQHNALVSKDAYGWANLPEMYRKRSLHILPGMVVTRNGVFMTKLVSQVGHICDISEIDQAVTKERFNSTEDDRYCVSDRFLVLHHHWKALCHYLLLLNELGCLFVTKPKSLA